MTYHGSRKQEYEQPNGIRRMELRFSGDIGSDGKLKLKRCVGRSFLDKSNHPAGTSPAQTMDAISAEPIRSA